MKIRKVHVKSESREESLFPYLKIPLMQRLRNANAVDLKNNIRIEEVDGYLKITAINRNKKL